MSYYISKPHIDDGEEILYLSVNDTVTTRKFNYTKSDKWPLNMIFIIKLEWSTACMEFWKIDHQTVKQKAIITYLLENINIVAGLATVGISILQ